MTTHSFPISANELNYVYETPRKKNSILNHPSCRISLVLLVFLVILALFGPKLSGFSFKDTILEEKNLAPSMHHICGTDDLGRDLFCRMCHGLQISLLIGITAAFLDMCIGVIWGSIAGMFQGKVDLIMMRIAETIYCIPCLLFVILMTVAIGPGILPIIVGMIIVGWIQMARICRLQVIVIKKQEYVQAARALGVSEIKILFRHIFPNLLGSIVTTTMLTIPQAIFAESFLSFLGIGIQPPMASLGSMISDAIAAMRFYPWRLFFPAALITITIFAFNLLGDACRDVLDPKSRSDLQ